MKKSWAIKKRRKRRIQSNSNFLNLFHVRWSEKQLKPDARSLLPPTTVKIFLSLLF